MEIVVLGAIKCAAKSEIGKKINLNRAPAKYKLKGNYPFNAPLSTPIAMAPVTSR